MSETKGFDSKIVELSNKKSELRERFLVASLANIAASYREALDRRGSQPYEYAQNVLSYCGINYKEVEPVEPEIRKDFSEFCKEQRRIGGIANQIVASTLADQILNGDGSDVDWFDQDSTLDQAQPEDKPESKLVAGLDGVLIQAGDEFAVFHRPLDGDGIIDPKNFDHRLLRHHKGDVCYIPPNSFALARSIEYFKMPRNVLGLCLGKSTYARAGIVANFTPFEPCWEGFVTIEISNTAPLPAKVYANEGFAQVIFFMGEEPTTVYGDGKYQGQTGITTARV